MATLIGWLVTLAEMIGDLVGISYAWVILAFSAIIVAVAYFAMYTPKGRGILKWLFINTITDTFDAAQYTIGNLSGAANGVVKAFIDAFNGPGKGIVGELTAPMGTAAKAAVAAVSAHLTGTGTVTPPNWQKNANDAMQDAFAFGLASFGATAAFESLFPERLNVLNGVGPMLATMAGFEEVTKSWLAPLLDASIGRPAKYDANARTRSVQLAEQSALNLYSRGLITKAAAEQFLAYAGHPDADIASMLAGAFHPVQPFVLATSLSDGTIDDADIKRALTYTGFRPQDQALLLNAFHQRLKQPYRQSALRALKTAFQRGLISQQELTDGYNTLEIPAEVQGYINLEMGYTKLVELADLYRRGLDEAASYGLEPLANYVNDLEAIGLGQSDADAHFAIIQSKVQGKALQAEQRAEAAQIRATLRARTQALQEQYMAGTIPDAGVVAALIALGYSPASAATIYATWQARKQGRQEFIYGVLLDKPAAVLLRERVAVQLELVKKLLITPAAAQKVLQGLGVPPANAQALIADAYVTAAKKA